MYQTQTLSKNLYPIFKGVYEDFKLNSFKDYKFELEPLTYEEFIQYFEKGILGCIVLTESDIPTAFLAYTTMPEEAVELHIIHCLGDENLNDKRAALVERFLETVKDYRHKKVISYPMLGKQQEFSAKISNYGFDMVRLGVVAFGLNNPTCIKVLRALKTPRLPIGYKMVTYKDFMFDDVARVIHESFKNTNDVNYDPRFASLDGSIDILSKITEEVYGQFLPQASKILLFENRPVGICLMNVTAGTIGNIPLVGIVENHRSKGMSKIMLKTAMEDILRANKIGFVRLNEVNASVEIDNTPAVKMYKDCGFKEVYTYPQAFAYRLVENIPKLNV